ncbi:hypothetical protein CO172_03530 [Candidatus Uhrbacteria bacterium CG_4_9_14_3_um_filter_36_7]|uniref:Uncharacterized protein n=1 Tax=Candidatus Uhrbacteria bacterium CG_4_9_14_3_um_filter_36_7 TaxID=1975033 RepID=A0A2M7XFY3_9BACT|nr:MAG: hypothetical protein CO172_03530 [Candidatus Uhrbacteria bacterium CG_4_9_14_3_um_filter_36_7]
MSKKQPVFLFLGGTFFLFAFFMSLPSFWSFSVQANTNDWQPIKSQSAWTYDGYKVERLSNELRNFHLYQLGEQSIFASEQSLCGKEPCEAVDWFFVKNGLYKKINDVPARLLSLGHFEKSNQRFVSIEPAQEEINRYVVYEYNKETGEKERLLEDTLFFQAVSDLDVFIDEQDNIFFNQEFEYQQDTNYKQSVVYVWDSSRHEADVVLPERMRRREEIQDVQNGLVLVKMVFDKGQQQLWLYDAKYSRAHAIADTWTEEPGSIEGAHFRSDGSIEFFQYFKHYLYDPLIDTAPRLQENQYLSWYRPVRDAVQIKNDRMVWLDLEDTLYLSDENGVVKIGTAIDGEFSLQENSLYYRTISGSTGYEFATGETKEIPFMVTDKFSDRLVGINEQGRIYYLNLSSQKLIEMGYGEEPYLADENHLYWKGQDGFWYEGTILLSSKNQIASARILEDRQTGQMNLLINETTWYTLPDEDPRILKSWFGLEYMPADLVHASSLQEYSYGGLAPFAPGTRLKLVGDKKVYLVGSDGWLYWMTSESVARAILADEWNQDIIEITQEDLTKLQFGSPLISEADAQNI